MLIFKGTADFDDVQSASWGASDINQLEDEGNYDVRVYARDRLRANSNMEGGIALVDGEASYETCASATTYDLTVDFGRDVIGSNLCFITTEGRYAYATVVGHDTIPIRFDLAVTVWDPPADR